MRTGKQRRKPSMGGARGEDLSAAHRQREIADLLGRAIARVVARRIQPLELVGDSFEAGDHVAHQEASLDLLELTAMNALSVGSEPLSLTGASDGIKAMRTTQRGSA